MGDKGFRIIGLSTSVADYEEIGEWIGATTDNIFNFHPNIRQNMVEIIFSSYDQHFRESRLYMMQKNVINTTRFYGRNAITFVSDKKQMKLTALDFASLLSIDEQPKRLRKIDDKQMKIFAKNISDQYLVNILEYGVGYVYEGMSEIEK